MKIAFISTFDINDKTARSGVPYSIFHYFLKDNDVTYINPQNELIYNIGYFFHKIIVKSIRLFGYTISNSYYLSYITSLSINHYFKNNHYDAIFALNQFDIVFLKTNTPCYVRTDTLFRSATSIFSIAYPKWYIRHCYELEKKSLYKIECLFAASQWMIDEAKKWYPNLPDNKIRFIPTGANLNIKDIQYTKREYSLTKPLKMLFIGYDIIKKGLNIAFEVFCIMNSKYKIKTSLTVIGGKPNETMLKQPSFCYIGMLDKNNPDDMKKLCNELASANLFIFPTKHEYHGIVNCEAAAYGLPIFSYNTCGVSSYVINGFNGYLLPLGSEPTKFAEIIYNSIKSEELTKMSANSRYLFERYFNWNSWGKESMSIMKNNLRNK